MNVKLLPSPYHLMDISLVNFSLTGTGYLSLVLARMTLAVGMLRHMEGIRKERLYHLRGFGMAST